MKAARASLYKFEGCDFACAVVPESARGMRMSR